MRDDEALDDPVQRVVRGPRRHCHDQHDKARERIPGRSALQRSQIVDQPGFLLRRQIEIAFLRLHSFTTMPSYGFVQRRRAPVMKESSLALLRSQIDQRGGAPFVRRGEIIGKGAGQLIAHIMQKQIGEDR